MIPTGLRLPHEVHEAITKAAKDEGRSMNAQIVVVLKEYLKQRQAGSESEKQGE